MRLSYLGRSTVQAGPYRSTIELKPNLSREMVWFDGELAKPIRFREAISALHDVVVGDLRFRRRDRSAYDAWKQRVAAEEAELRARFERQAQQEIQAKRTAPEPLPPEFESRHRAVHQLYWKARRQYAADLMRDDPELFRHLVPCDPIVTVAPDALLFEGFSKDESSYGCVVVDRDAAGGCPAASLGTTNVDYSLGLYEHFQTLRSYRETRLHVDPGGFEVQVEGAPDYREEKIDLPPSWLRGFGQISAATGLPTRPVELPVEVLYSILATLRRRREKHGPRSIRFLLEPGRPPTLVLDPWDLEIPSRGAPYGGERQEEIKVWGRRRLMVLARVLPLVERVEVHLLGSGMPSIWVARLGEMSFVLGLSGWTANDWSSGANLDLLTATWQADEWTIEKVAELLRRERAATRADLEARSGAPKSEVRAALHRLAQRGQCLFDFSTGCYRWRSILPEALGEKQLGPEPVELTEGRRLFVDRAVMITGREALPKGRQLITADVRGTRVETILDADGVMTRAKCPCPHHRRFGIRKGPCRHLLALRLQAQGVEMSYPTAET